MTSRRVLKFAPFAALLLLANSPPAHPLVLGFFGAIGVSVYLALYFQDLAAKVAKKEGKHLGSGSIGCLVSLPLIIFLFASMVNTESNFATLPIYIGWIIFQIIRMQILAKMTRLTRLARYYSSALIGLFFVAEVSHFAAIYYFDAPVAAWGRASSNTFEISRALGFYASNHGGAYPISPEDLRPNSELSSIPNNPYRRHAQMKRVPWGQPSAGDYSYWVSSDHKSMCLVGYSLGKGLESDTDKVRAATILPRLELASEEDLQQAPPICLDEYRKREKERRYAPK